MASWNDVRGFLSKEFPISTPTDDTVRVNFEYDDGRSHFADVTLVTEPEPMLRISAPVCERADADESAVYWAVAKSGIPYGVIHYTGPFQNLDCVGIGHVVLLDGLSGDALAFAVGTIAACADDIEAEVRGGVDDFVSEEVLQRLMASRLQGAGKCGSCGTERSGNGRFCSNCGVAFLQ